MIPNMAKYRVIWHLPVCDVPQGGTVEGSAIPDVELLLQACAIAPIKESNKSFTEVEQTDGEASSH